MTFERSATRSIGVISPAIQHGGGPLNSSASAAPLPIPQELALELSAAVRSPGQTHIVTDIAGRPATPWSVRGAIAAAKAAAPAVPPEMRFDDLRHCFAGLLIGLGLDVEVVQTRLRHASVTTTLNTYGHLWPDADESARAAGDRCWRRGRTR